mmetsp:Transcript_18787/g.35664  ORF Transcript_18787/g.35664 Transcript_18787/m.35664 type:complete len:133 (-) Transcript_18787:2924-3322(-)|eukprot:scaffold1581_cov169-Amphora_coffeaeformis.AAC.38
MSQFEIIANDDIFSLVEERSSFSDLVFRVNALWHRRSKKLSLPKKRTSSRLSSLSTCKKAHTIVQIKNWWSEGKLRQNCRIRRVRKEINASVGSLERVSERQVNCVFGGVPRERAGFPPGPENVTSALFDRP